ALCRAGACRDGRSAGRAVSRAGPRRHQTALRCGARNPLRLCGAGREGRDRQPARRGQRTDAQTRVRDDRGGRGRSTGASFPRQAAGLLRGAARHLDTPTYDRAALIGGNRIAGPALIEEYASTTVLHPGDVLTVDAYGDLMIEIMRS